MSAARVDNDGTVTPLGSRSAPAETVSEQDVQEPTKLARVLARLLEGVADLRREFRPRRLDFYDITTTNGGTIRLQHNFAGRVVWWPIDYLISGASAAPIIQRDSTNTTTDTLVLLSYTTGIVTIRVEESG